MEVNVWTVFVAASLTALATGLGALPFFVFPQMSRSWLGISNSLAAGFMLGASAVSEAAAKTVQRFTSTRAVSAQP